jgi:hypothetical protein
MSQLVLFEVKIELAVEEEVVQVDQTWVVEAVVRLTRT